MHALLHSTAATNPVGLLVNALVSIAKDAAFVALRFGSQSVKFLQPTENNSSASPRFDHQKPDVEINVTEKPIVADVDSSTESVNILNICSTREEARVLANFETREKMIIQHHRQLAYAADDAFVIDSKTVRGITYYVMFSVKLDRFLIAWRANCGTAHKDWNIFESKLRESEDGVLSLSLHNLNDDGLMEYKGFAFYGNGNLYVRIKSLPHVSVCVDPDALYMRKFQKAAARTSDEPSIDRLVTDLVDKSAKSQFDFDVLALGPQAFCNTNRPKIEEFEAVR